MFSLVPIVLMVWARPGTVVMVHGAGGGGWEYDYWKPIFQKAGWKVVAPDLVPVKGGYAKTTFGDYKNQVMSWALGAKRPMVVVGASMGGGLALSTSSALRPDAIVLVDSVAPADVNVERKPAEFPDIVRWANGPIKDTRDAMPDSDEKTIKWAWKKWRDESGAVMRELVKGVVAPKPECPVLVMWGDKDTDIPVATGMAMVKHYGADVIVFRNTSHVGPLLGKRAKEAASFALDWVNERMVKQIR